MKKIFNFISGNRVNMQIIVVIVCVVLTILATTVKIIHGFDIDEGYALSMSMRLINGDNLVKNLWDPYQFSSIFLTPFLYLFNIVSPYNSNYLVLFTRIGSVLVQLVVSICLFYYLKKETKKVFLSFILTLCYFNFLPKQIQNIDHATTLVWFTTLFSISCASYLKYKDDKVIIPMAIFYCGMILAYPTQILLFPFILYVIYKSKKRNIGQPNQYKDIFIFCFSCLLIGCMVILYINPIYLIENIPNIASDGSHSFSPQYLTYRIASEALRLLMIVLPTYCIAMLMTKILKIKCSSLHCLIIVNCILFFAVAFINLLGLPWAPLALYVRYFLLTITGCLLLSEENQFEIKVLFKIILLSFFICFLSSNNGIDAASGYLILTSIFSIVLIYVKFEKDKNRKLILIASFLIFSVFSSEILIKYNSIRLTGTPFENKSSVTKKGERMLQGIWITDEQFAYYQDSFQTLEQLDGNLIYCGTESIIQFFGNYNIISPTTTGTPSFDVQWIYYLENKNLNNMLLLIQKQYDFGFFENTELGIYLSNNYNIELVDKTTSNVLYRIKK